MYGHLRLFGLLGLLGIGFGMHAAPLVAAEAYDPWPGLVQDIFNNRPMSDGSDVIAIEMPYRAEDAAIVPVTLRSKLAPDDSRRLRTVTLVIDQNPAPMAAKFELGTDARVSEISTRVRVNSYTNVHAVAELSDGKLYMVKTFVKASGSGCARASSNRRTHYFGSRSRPAIRQRAWHSMRAASSIRQRSSPRMMIRFGT